ncbi:unnamed protein product [Nippostrongylus brasiliensis]|uniref:Tyrosinase_Cu-bd domain-containing protein n=1 Tax=Nippostrongylus brasiliensis TaxID=27835 RepID=A0A0N4Y6D6_NIPBR|nr:unnamed protein product [Nippostrongylus brasiliensis]
MRRLLALLLLAFVFVDAAEDVVRRKEPPRDCSDAPNKDIKQTCLMQRRRGGNGGNRAAVPAGPPAPVGPPDWLLPIPVPPNARGQVAYHPYDCMTLACLCPFFAGTMQGGHCVLANNVVLRMSYRKEYRMMTDDERNRWHNALATLKANGEYDRLSRQHFDKFCPVALFCRVEIALRMVDPTVAIPYWDSVMDNYLPDPRDSIIFSNLFAGETDFYGNVIQGPFAYWRTLEGRSTILRQVHLYLRTSFRSRIAMFTIGVRNLGREGSLFNENQVNNVVAQNTIENTLAYTAPLAGCPYPNNYGAIEYIHSNVHLWVGGDMKPPSTSANEPLFFMHHSFVDYLWELWRQLKQPRWLREVAYSNDHGYCTNQLHFSWAYMRPFPYLQNRDGLSNSYTDQMYRYAPRPSCSLQNPNCGSPYLFCDTRGYPHCVAKIKMNGNCQGFENFDACYMGRCWWGRCIPGNRAWASKILKNVKAMNSSLTLGLISTSGGSDDEPVVQQTSSRPVKMVAPLFQNCFNRSPCCKAWADHGLCSAQAEYMGVYCGGSCGVCTPSYNISSTECRDFHPMCQQFKAQGLCGGKSAEFMMENCQHACGACSVPKDQMCYKNGKLNMPLIPKSLVLAVQDAIDSDVRERGFVAYCRDLPTSNPSAHAEELVILLALDLLS